MEQFLHKNASEPKQKSSPMKSQVFRNNQWVDPSSSSSSDYTDSSDTEPNYK